MTRWAITPRSRMLAVALVATLLVSGWLALQPEPVAPVVPSEVAGRAPAPIERWPEPTAGALAAWAGPATVVVPDPPAAAPAEPAAAAEPPPAPPPAEAPAPPWRWIGRIDDAAGRAALLDGPAFSRLVREQEVLDGQWRLERIADDGLHWRWLPGGQARVQGRS